MKNLFFIFSLLGFIPCIAFASSTETNLNNPKEIKGHGYFGLLTGVSFRYPERASGFYKSFYTGTVTGIFGGYDFNRWKLELEVSDIENSVNLLTSKINTYVTAQEWSVNMMGNGYYVPFDFKTARPYLGAGIGYAVHSYAFHRENSAKNGEIFNFNHIRKYSNGFSYQAIAGIEFPLNHSVNFDLEYRFWGMPSILYKPTPSYSGVSTSLTSNLFLIKLTYKFP